MFRQSSANKARGLKGTNFSKKQTATSLLESDDL